MLFIEEESRKMPKRNEWPCPYCKGQYMNDEFCLDDGSCAHSYCGFCRDGFIRRGDDRHRQSVKDSIFKSLYKLIDPEKIPQPSGIHEHDQGLWSKPALNKHIQDLIAMACDLNNWTRDSFCEVCDTLLENTTFRDRGEEDIPLNPHMLCSRECENVFYKLRESW